MIPVMIDTDPGIDDALAIFLACAAPELDIRAITTVARQLPTRFTVVRAMSISSSTPRIRATASRGRL